MLEIISKFAFLFPNFLQIHFWFVQCSFCFLLDISRIHCASDTVKIKYILIGSVHYSSRCNSNSPDEEHIRGSHPPGSTHVLSGSNQADFTTCSPASGFVFILSLLPDWSYFRARNIFYLPNVPYTDE